MIRAEKAPGRLRIRGHAGYAPPGQDIVCAAVSILAETLASMLPPERIFLGEGRADFDCREEEMEFVWRGLSLLAHRYPENISLVINRP